MSTRRRRKSALPAPAPVPAGEVTAAFERQKHAFLLRNAVRCPWLLVQLEPDPAARRVTLIASFAFTAERAWQQVETPIEAEALAVEAGPEPRFAEAFARLDEAIGAARIARLFAPRGEPPRVAVGR